MSTTTQRYHVPSNLCALAASYRAMPNGGAPLRETSPRTNGTRAWSLNNSMVEVAHGWRTRKSMRFALTLAGFHRGKECFWRAGPEPKESGVGFYSYWLMGELVADGNGVAP